MRARCRTFASTPKRSRIGRIGVDKVNELGEFKSSFVSEDGETYKVFTLGGITAISRQVWVNSAGRLGSLSDAMGRRMAADVSDRRVAYLEGTANAGPVMRDGQAVFYSGRGNIATLDITSFTTIIDTALLARAAASKRKGQGDVMIGQAPTVWLVPPEFEGARSARLRMLQRLKPRTSILSAAGCRW